MRGQNILLPIVIMLVCARCASLPAVVDCAPPKILPVCPPSGGNPLCTAQVSYSKPSPLPQPFPLVQTVSSTGGILSPGGGTFSITTVPAPEGLPCLTQSGQTNVYEGQYIPPVWFLNPNEKIELTLVNKMDPAQNPASLVPPCDATHVPPGTTNLHYHGFNVSPAGTAGQPSSDNVFLQVPVDGSQQYSVSLPPTHPVGSFWFHPHPHCISEPQVLGGMSGVAIVKGLVDYYPDKFPGGVIEETLSTFFILKDYMRSDQPSCAFTKTINGVLMGTQTVTAGQNQLWRFANAGADSFFNIQLIGSNGQPVTFDVISVDGNPTVSVNADQSLTPYPQPRTNLLLVPGSRMDVIVNLPAGGYSLWHANVDTGPWGDPNCAVQLGWVESVQPIATPKPLPRRAASPRLPPDRLSLQALQQQFNAQSPTTCPNPTFTVKFSEDPPPPPSQGPQKFYINDQQYDPAQAPHIVNLGCVERWTITNPSQEMHVFHIHQLDFIVEQISSGGTPVAQTFTGYQDTVIVPPSDGTNPGSATVLIPFTDPVIAGNFVYHCHILMHEDAGMMANICVQGSDNDCSAMVHGNH